MNDQLPNQDFFTQPEEIIDPLYLDLDDDLLVKTTKDNIKASVEYYTKKKLYTRQEKNFDYYIGNQNLYQASTKAKSYKENVIYEAISRTKPIELSRMPDLVVKHGSDEPEAKESAEQLTGIFNSDSKRRDNRKLLGLASKLEPLYFFACIKARWNPEKGAHGDYEYVNVHPNNVKFDHHSPDNDANKMRFVSEKTELMLKEVIMMFPDKEAEIKEEFGWMDGEKANKGAEEKLASPISLIETWFHWYKLSGEDTERIDGVVWIYGNLLLKKMKNPYFDFQGHKKMFSKVMKEKDEISIDEVFDMFDAQNEELDNEEMVYNNYFQDPEKPYFFMVYENMGLQPIGETSRVEQILEFQDSLNQDGSIISDMNIRSRGKDIFSTEAIPQTTLDNIDIYDVDQVLGIEVPQGSSIANVHARIEQKPATPQQYKSMSENRQKSFEIMAVGATTRGLHEPDSTLGESQMAKEADYGVIDDIVEDTINAVAEWQANWAMQFIKLFYTKPHMRHILGKDGDVLHTRLTQDIVDDGMEVVVSASGVDKMIRRRMAIENAKIGYGNPLDFFQDTEQSNPKERALRAMMFTLAPQMYMQTYLMEKQEPDPNTPITNQVMGQDQPSIPGDQQPVNNQPPVQQ